MAKYGIIEYETGETWDTQFNLRFTKWDKPKMEDYFMGFKMDIVAADKRLQGNDVRVFIYLCTKMKPGGWIEVTQSYVSTHLKITRTNVSAAISRLIQYGYLEYRIGRDTGRRKLRVCETIAGKGSYAMRRAIQTDIEDDMPIAADLVEEYCVSIAKPA